MLDSESLTYAAEEFLSTRARSAASRVRFLESSVLSSLFELVVGSLLAMLQDLLPPDDANVS